MIAPAIWFFFVYYMDGEVSKAGSFENAVVALRENSSEQQKRELLKFFDEAARAKGEKCQTLKLQGSDTEVYMDFPDDSCSEFYAEVAEIFRAD